LGKSTLTNELAARLSRGDLPGALAGTPTDTLIVGYEDSARSTVKPRLLAAGADPARIHQIRAEYRGSHDLVSLPDDVERIAECAREHGARLLIVDPFSASLGTDVNSHRDQDIRRALAPMAQLAEDADLAVLLLAHFNKAQGGDSLSRVLGSRGLTAAVRSVLVFGRAPDAEEGSPDRVLAHAACNLAREAPSLTCRIEPRVIEDEIGNIETSRLVIVGETDTAADDLLATRGEDERTDREIAADWLGDELADGEWHKAGEVKASAKAAGISERTLHRARSLLEVEVRREGFPAVSEWRIAVVPWPTGTTGTTGTTEGGTTRETRNPEPNPTDLEAQLRQVSNNGTTSTIGT
jgi:RecA-family ATPase